MAIPTMQCPGCGLYHPARYEQCVSCGRKLNAQAQADDEVFDDSGSAEAEPELDETETSASGRKHSRGAGAKKGLPVGMIIVAVGILLASAGGTYFFLSRPPESERLLVEGQKQLANGQFAFAQKTLEQAMAIKPNDPKVLLSLARAYVGTDQVEKAWSCISQAQQTGAGLLTEPALSSDLAKYYVQRNQYSRASELLRPLAQQNLPRKKAELADLNALWGDECFNKGDTQQALKCWEEIKSLGEGSRVNECDTRLATIYQKMANEFLAKDDIESALRCLNNLNNIAASPQSCEKVAELYAKQGKLDLAIDQMRKAIKLGSGSHDLNRKLAGYLSRRGKELLDKGDAETGYAYLQQAQGYDGNLKVPSVALRAININVDGLSGTVRVSGEAWNPGPNSVAYLSVRTELFDTKASQSVWSKDQHIVDEFVAPLQGRESRQFDFSGPVAVGQPGLEVRVYLDSKLYKTYSLDERSSGSTQSASGQPQRDPMQPISPAPGTETPVLKPPINPPVQSNPFPAQSGNQGGLTPEERTLRDLE